MALLPFSSFDKERKTILDFFSFLFLTIYLTVIDNSNMLFLWNLHTLFSSCFVIVVVPLIRKSKKKNIKVKKKDKEKGNI